MPQRYIINHFIYMAALLMVLTGCYRMPTEDDYCVIPTTNNPDVTGEKRTSPIPGVKY
ncbi:MAG: hypothetical protein LLG04_07580 [Parachlamydia sp.]|nr:hypothetical protein [Parachlamydia sp.]